MNCFGIPEQTKEDVSSLLPCFNVIVNGPSDPSGSELNEKPLPIKDEPSVTTAATDQPSLAGSLEETETDEPNLEGKKKFFQKFSFKSKKGSNGTPASSIGLGVKSKRKDKKKKGWKEYTDPSSGNKYYSDGKTTTWEKPENYPGNNSSPVSTSANDAAIITTNDSPDASTQDKTTSFKIRKSKKGANGWREYLDTNTMKKYYWNGVTTTWERPANFDG